MNKTGKVLSKFKRESINSKTIFEITNFIYKKYIQK